jgi:uncharacterized protein DUF6879
MASELQQHFKNLKRSAFRLETLDSYDVGREDEDFRRFLAGEPLPLDNNDDWCDQVRAATQTGKTYERIHLLPPVLTPYLRYEIDWGYVFNAAAGEQISVITTDAPSATRALATTDFWLFDDETVLVMHYDATNKPAGITSVKDEKEVAAYRHIRDEMRDHATPLKEFLAGLRTA